METVLLTGATGNMGLEGLKLLCAHGGFLVKVLALPTRKDKEVLKRYERLDHVSVIWGDLASYQDVKLAVADADIVLHVGALVSPMADSQPELAWKINFGGTKHIVDAILERDDRDMVKLVYIGTVAETGNRPAPYHWGRIGDPLAPSVYDNYAVSKIAAERYVIESGLRHWVSLRQTGIIHENILEVDDGIGYHQPLNNHLEWVTAHDSGRILLNICSEAIPESFWRNVYNVGGGESCRLTAFEFMDKLYRSIGVDLRDLQDPNWFAARNFHGQYYYDSDLLNDYLDFRSQDVDDIVELIKKKLPLSMRLLKYLPKKWLKEKIIRKQALKGDTPLKWISDGDEDKIKAFFGSRENYDQIPGWDGFELISDPPNKKLDHGYDEEKPDEDLQLLDLQSAANFRGGVCLSTKMKRGDLQMKLTWSCAHGHEFEASPFLVLKTGHWCPKCIKPPWNFDEQARRDPFLAQVWYADHERDEDHVYE